MVVGNEKRDYGKGKKNRRQPVIEVMLSHSIGLILRILSRSDD